MIAKSTITTILFLSLFSQIFANQVVPFWQEDFSGDQLPSNWIVEDESINPVEWQQCTGFVSCPLADLNSLDLFPDERFQSFSQENGYAYIMPFTEGGAHRSYLQTPMIDCSDKTEVFVSFNTFIMVRHSRPDKDAILEVRSANNPNWTAFTIFPHLNQNQVEFDPNFPIGGSLRLQSYNGQHICLDISDIAAQEEQVEIRWKWEWSGEEEYCWLVDDVQLLDANPLDKNVVWGNLPGEGDFDGGLNDWTSTLSQPCQWEWSPDGLVNFPDDNLADGTACSCTLGNGVALMNAFCDEEPANHLAELISPTIDLSSISPDTKLGVRFNQSGRKGNNNSNLNLPLNSIMVSIDGGSTFIDTIFQNVTEPFNKGFCKNTMIPLPSEVSGASEFVFKFIFSGSSVFWIIDDVRIVELNEYDLKVSEDYFAVAENYSTPSWMIQPMSFLAEVQNVGSLDQDNVRLNLRIIEDTSHMIVFRDSLLLGNIASGEFGPAINFPQTFVPEANKAYTAFYEVTGANDDQNPNNNIVSFRFRTDKNYFSKNKDKYSMNGGFAPQGVFLNYEIGNCYYIPEGGKVAATGMQFALADPDDLYEIGFTLGINLYRWSKGGNKGDVNGDLRANTNEFEKVVDTFFTVNEKYYLFDIIEVPFSGELIFEEDTYYFVTVDYFAPVNGAPFFIAASEEVNYSAAYEKSLSEGRPAYVSMLRKGLESDFEVNAWGLLRIPFIQLKVDGFTETEPVAVGEGSISLFPNPAADIIYLDLTIADIRSGLAYEIYDICGRLVQPRQTVAGYVSQLPIDISQLDDGIYNLHVISEGQVYGQTIIKSK